MDELVTSSAEVSWMLSAFIQSGGAIVAIVAGFVVSRYVSIDASRSQAAHRRDEKAREAKAADEIFRTTKYQRDRAIAEDALEKPRVYEALREQGLPETAELEKLASLETGKIAPEVLTECAETIANEVHNAFRYLENEVELKPTQQMPTWERFAKEKGLWAGSEIWEWAYEVVVEEKRAEEDRKERERDPIGAALGRGWGRMISTFAPVSLIQKSQILFSAESRSRYMNLDLSLAEGNRERTQEALDAAQRELERLGKPHGFGLALRVLAWIAVLTMGIPTVLLVMGFRDLSIGWRSAIGCAFALAVFLLLRYLTVYKQYLEDDHPRKILPKGVFRMLSPMQRAGNNR